MPCFSSCASAKMVQYVIITPEILALVFHILCTRTSQSFFSFVFSLVVFLLVLMGHLNFADGTWEYHTTVTSNSGKFLKYVEDSL